ncbi:MAG: hypothetical protein HXY38_06880 [Chloroflexi bacterium]|nr:hypothetical protein [Chloroflexota bacterium]
MTANGRDDSKTNRGIAALHRGVDSFRFELGRGSVRLFARPAAGRPQGAFTLADGSRAPLPAAAVIGRDFSANLLAHVAEFDETDLLASLDELWQRHILREGERERYDFSHDKLREYIYTSLSPARRNKQRKPPKKRCN